MGILVRNDLVHAGYWLLLLSYWSYFNRHLRHNLGWCCSSNVRCLCPLCLWFPWINSILFQLGIHTLRRGWSLPVRLLATLDWYSSSLWLRMVLRCRLMHRQIWWSQEGRMGSQYWILGLTLHCWPYCCPYGECLCRFRCLLLRILFCCCASFLHVGKSVIHGILQWHLLVRCQKNLLRLLTNEPKRPKGNHVVGANLLCLLVLVDQVH